MPHLDLDAPVVAAVAILAVAIVLAVGMFVRASNLDQPSVIDARHLARQARWSERTFGPGTRHEGVRDHIQKEITEAETDPEEWVDVIILDQ